MPMMALSDAFVISDDESGIPEFEKISTPALAELPEINGEANTGITYAQL